MMFIVICWATPVDIAATYGPFTDEPTARRFAEFVTDEVDRATVHRLGSPVTELLNWRDATGEA